MFTSFDENEFRKAMKEKNYNRLKVNVVSSMLNDPTFARGETKKVLEILDNNVPEIFEEEVRLGYEERLERKDWDKRYFTKLTYWFQENFAKSRVNYIKEVGRVVHQDTAQKYNESINSQQRGRVPNPTRARATKGKKLPVPGVIAAVVALVLLVVLLVKLLLK